jgi:hypothetical protein
MEIMMFKETQIEIPTLGEVMEAGIDMNDPFWVYKVSAMSIGISFEEFQKWPFDEAVALSGKVALAFTSYS